MIVYKDVFKLLAEHGWNTYNLVKDKILGNSTITRLRQGRPISTETIDTLCRLCDCQPGELLGYVPDDEGS